MPKIIQDADEVPLVLHSEVDGPIAGLSFLRKALLFAELSMIAYNDQEEASRASAAIGFPDAVLFEHDGSQAFRFQNQFDCVIAVRGTEPNEWNDIQADVNVGTVLAETVGKVHRGFKREVDDIWPMLETQLSRCKLPLWFCGHSLGGAMATICAARCFRSVIPCNPEGLFTYGAPRVGDRAYVRHVQLDHYRFVNNNDLVTRVPPRWLGYCHSGDEVYFNSVDRIEKITGWKRARDRLKGTFRGMLKGRIDGLADHQIHRYIQCILKEMGVEAGRLERGGASIRGSEVAILEAREDF